MLKLKLLELFEMFLLKIRTKCLRNGLWQVSLSSKSLLLCILFLLIPPGVWAAPNIGLKPIVIGLSSPVAITHAGDGSGRLFITLKGGKTIIYDGSKVLPEPFIDLSSLVSTNSERGLLSIAFHPSYESNGFVFVDYTDTDGNTVISGLLRDQAQLEGLLSQLFGMGMQLISVSSDNIPTVDGRR